VLTVCCFKWKPPIRDARYTGFGPAAVVTLRNMVRRHYPKPHRFVCLTDDNSGLEDVEALPLWTDYAGIPSPHGGQNPSCYRRLKLFDPAIRDVLGERFVSIDLDAVIVGDLTPIFDRREDFLMWGETDPRSFYNGSLMMQTAGARPQVWRDFHPQISPGEALRAGRFGSDQGWISYKLGPGEATWGRKDGVYSYRVHIQPMGGYLPKDARITFWHGRVKPWDAAGQRVPWVRQFYK
jgi:hypothetical protein